MSADLRTDVPVDRLEVIDSLRPRLAPVAGERDLEAMINSALDELSPAHVTTYLPILVERRVREQLGQAETQPPGTAPPA